MWSTRQRRSSRLKAGGGGVYETSMLEVYVIMLILVYIFEHSHICSLEAISPNIT